MHHLEVTEEPTNLYFTAFGCQVDVIRRKAEKTSTKRFTEDAALRVHLGYYQ